MSNAQFVLVHGGSFNSKYWDLLVPHLDGEVLAVDLPGRGTKPADINDASIDLWVHSVIDDIRAAGFNNATLVGHSLAGITLAGVAAVIPERINHVVFSSCTIPAKGKKAVDLLRPDIRDFLLPISLAVVSGKLRLDTKNGEQSDAVNPTELLGPNAPADLVEYVKAAHRRVAPEALTVLFEHYPWNGIDPSIPSTYIKNKADLIVTPDLQDIMIRNIGSPNVIELDQPHCPEITAPAEVAKILNQIASNT